MKDKPVSLFLSSIKSLDQERKRIKEQTDEYLSSGKKISQIPNTLTTYRELTRREFESKKADDRFIKNRCNRDD